MNRTRYGRSASGVAITVAALGILLVLHSLAFSFVHLRKGVSLMREGHFLEGRWELESAASRPFPGNVFADRAWRLLKDRASGFEEAGEPWEAAVVHISMLGIANATRSPLSPYEADRAYLEGRIRTASERYPGLARDLYSRYRMPDPLFAWLAILSLGISVWFSWVGLGRERPAGRALFVAGGLLFLAGYAFFLWLA